MIFKIFFYGTSAFLILIFSVLVIYYFTVLRKIKGFPVYHVIPKVIQHLLTRKRDTPSFNVFLFQMMEDMYKKHSRHGFCMSYKMRPILYVFNEELVKMFLNDKATINKSPDYKILAKLVGHGLITRNGEKWKAHRKVINPAFQLGMLKEKIPLFNEHAAALIQDLKALEGTPCSEYLHFIKRHYFNALNESIFGLKQNEENKAEIMKYFHVIDNLTMMTMYRIYQPWLWSRSALKFFPSGKKYLKMYDDLYYFTKNAILEMKKFVDSNKDSDDTKYFSKNLHKSLTYLLLQHHLKDPSFTFHDLHGEVNTIMSAGYDTVSYSTMWCLYMLGLHPQVQEKAFQEVQSEFHDYVTDEEISSYTYLDSVIMETLRLYPTIPLVSRSLSRDVQFGKYKIHKGTTLALPLYFYHRNPDIYPDPEKFDPERFLIAKDKKPWQHAPFSEGNRVCLGKKYAMIEMKIFLAHILRNFKITSLDKREDIQLCCSVVLTPEKPLHMLIEPRLITS